MLTVLKTNGKMTVGTADAMDTRTKATCLTRFTREFCAGGFIAPTTAASPVDLGMTRAIIGIALGRSRDEEETQQNRQFVASWGPNGSSVLFAIKRRVQAWRFEVANSVSDEARRPWPL